MGKMSIPEKKAAVILIALIAYVLSTPLTGLNINYGFIVPINNVAHVVPIAPKLPSTLAHADAINCVAPQ